MTVQRVNINLNLELYEKFRKYATKNGVSILEFVVAKIQEYIDEQKEFQKYKRKKDEMAFIYVQ